MPTSYKFLVFDEFNGMRDASIRTQARKHAMKDIGATRRRPPKRQSYEVELVWQQDSAHRRHAVESPHEGIDRLSQRVMCSAPSPITSVLLNPFANASVAIYGARLDLLRYFIYYSSSTSDASTYSPVFLPYEPTTAKIFQIVLLAQHDALSMHCLLSAAASRMYYVDGVESRRYRGVELSSTQEALQLLQKRLRETLCHTTDAGEDLLASMLYLIGAAIYRGDITTAKVHLVGLARLVERKGGILEVQDQYQQGRLISVDDRLAVLELRPCLLRCDYDPGPFTRHHMFDTLSVAEEDQSLGSALLFEDVPLCPKTLRSQIGQLVECHHVQLRLASSGVSSSETAEVRQWLTLRTLSIRNRLLAFVTSHTHLHALRTALILWNLLPWNDEKSRIGTVRQALASRLKTFVRDPTLGNSNIREDLRLWCLMMGFSGADGDERAEVWYAVRIQELFRHRMNTSTRMTTAAWTDRLVIFQIRYLFQRQAQMRTTKKLAAWLVGECPRSSDTGSA